MHIKMVMIKDQPCFTDYFVDNLFVRPDAASQGVLKERLQNLSAMLGEVGVCQIEARLDFLPTETMIRPGDLIDIKYLILSTLEGNRHFDYLEEWHPAVGEQLKDGLALLAWTHTDHFSQELVFGGSARSCKICGHVQRGEQRTVCPTTYTWPSTQCLNLECYSHELGKMISDQYVIDEIVTKHKEFQTQHGEEIRKAIEQVLKKENG